MNVYYFLSSLYNCKDLLYNLQGQQQHNCQCHFTLHDRTSIWLHIPPLFLWFLSQWKHDCWSFRLDDSQGCWSHFRWWNNQSPLTMCVIAKNKTQIRVHHDLSQSLLMTFFFIEATLYFTYCIQSGDTIDYFRWWNNRRKNKKRSRRNFTIGW